MHLCFDLYLSYLMYSLMFRLISGRLFTQDIPVAVVVVLLNLERLNFAVYINRAARNIVNHNYSHSFNLITSYSNFRNFYINRKIA